MTVRSGESSESGRPTVAIVLSGAVARGAFQAGALAELVPALERDGLPPTVWLGTSACWRWLPRSLAVSTAKHGRTALAVLRQLYAGQPWLPTAVFW